MINRDAADIGVSKSLVANIVSGASELLSQKLLRTPASASLM